MSRAGRLALRPDRRVVVWGSLNRKRGCVVTRRWVVLFGPVGKFLCLGIVAVALALALPTMGTAKSVGTASTTVDGASAGIDAASAATLLPGPWSQAEPWRTLLEEGASAGSGMQVATLPPEIDPGWYDPANWTVSGTWALTDEWASTYGATTYLRTWSDSPGGNYLNNTDSSLTYETIDLSAVGDGQFVTLLFDCRTALLSGDYLWVDYSSDGGATYSYSEYLTGTDEGYYICDLFDDLVTDQFKLRFRLVTNGSGTADGVHIGNVMLVTSPTDYADQTDSRLAYVRGWTSVAASGADDGSYYVSSQAGAFVAIKFEGTALSWRYRHGPGLGYGYAEVTVDGVSAGGIDLGSSSYGGFGDYDIGPVDDGVHTVIIKCAWGKIAIDSFTAWGTIEDLNVTRVQENDPALAYTPRWSKMNTWSASGGSYASGVYPGCSVNIEFDGNYIAWYGTTLPSYGPSGRMTIQAFLDGVEVNTWELNMFYSSSPKYKQKIFDSGYLYSGHHTLSIYQWAEYGSGISVDAFDILGTLTSAETAPARITYYQEMDPRMTTIGNWTPTWTGSFTGAYYYGSVSTPGGGIVIDFTGDTFEWWGLLGSSCGQGLLSIDGGPEECIEFYRDAPAYRQKVFEKAGLGEGPHRLVMRRSGEKNSASTGYSISLDYLIMPGFLAETPKPARYQQNDTHLAYEGAWTTSATNWSLSGGTLTSVDGPGASLSVSFDGNYFSWIGQKGPGFGIAKVSVDDGPLQTVDLYSPWNSYKQKVYETGLLADGAHTVDIYWTGSKNAAASGTKMNMDAIDLLGDLVTADPAPPLTWRYQQNSAAITYLGSWSSASSGSASGGSYVGASQPGAAAVATFEGDSVVVLARTAPWYGEAEIYVDGALVKTADLYSSTVKWMQPVYTSTGLTDGEHTLVVKCKGNKNGSSSGTSIALDALDIHGYLRQAPQTLRLQETDPKVAYSGTWTSAGTWSASGGAYVSTDEAGAKVTFTFTGTYAAWVARTTAWYGIAQVSLYAGAVLPENLVETGPIDLYSATTGWKKTVYSTGLLPQDTYNLVIERKGDKYWKSWGKAIAVDAFDVLLATP
jgi:hypothetical protein